MAKTRFNWSYKILPQDANWQEIIHPGSLGAHQQPQQANTSSVNYMVYNKRVRLVFMTPRLRFWAFWFATSLKAFNFKRGVWSKKKKKYNCSEQGDLRSHKTYGFWGGKKC